jgi:uncharacterized protein (TIRG00374 family)
MRRAPRVAIQLALTGAVIAYLVWQIDIARSAEYVAASDPLYLLGATGIFIATMWPSAWRWQLLLASKGIHEPIRWLTKIYFVGYAASQILPTTVGGDAVRMIEHARRRPQAKGEAAGAVLMERAVGAAATLLLVAVGLVLAVGRYDNVQLLVRIELAFVAALVLFGVLLFSRRTNTFLQERILQGERAARLRSALSSLWTALHGYRSQTGALALALVISFVLQLVRTLAIWMCGEAVGLDLSPLVYIILGPLLFLVMMVPITLNGLGVRESFFVFFLDRFGVGPDAAFAAGFLFFAVTIAAALPGALIFGWSLVRGGPAPRAEPPVVPKADLDVREAKPSG